MSLSECLTSTNTPGFAIDCRKHGVYCVKSEDTTRLVPLLAGCSISLAPSRPQVSQWQNSLLSIFLVQTVFPSTVRFPCADICTFFIFPQKIGLSVWLQIWQHKGFSVEWETTEPQRPCLLQLIDHNIIVYLNNTWLVNLKFVFFFFTFLMSKQQLIAI